ncbi:hypothetical protein HAX54_049662, partial [Datura stramonium]|nr:hypothetical protein [Datura stramonium]
YNQLYIVIGSKDSPQILLLPTLSPPNSGSQIPPSNRRELWLKLLNTLSTFSIENHQPLNIGHTLFGHEGDPNVN